MIPLEDEEHIGGNVEERRGGYEALLTCRGLLVGGLWLMMLLLQSGDEPVLGFSS
jgi:hypothetical protein